MDDMSDHGFCLFPTALGECGIAWRGESIIATRLPDDSPEQMMDWLQSRTDSRLREPSEEVRDAITKIQAMLLGQDVDLTSIRCDFRYADPFERQVYDLARTIPFGTTWTYGCIAEELGDKRQARNVGRAIGRNPIPIIVPCHRVVGADGKLVGFSATGGIDMKRRMLVIEGAEAAGTLPLFDDLPLSPRPVSR